jgi:hypothetical protein
MVPAARRVTEGGRHRRAVGRTTAAGVLVRLTLAILTSGRAAIATTGHRRHRRGEAVLGLTTTASAAIAPIPQCDRFLPRSVTRNARSGTNSSARRLRTICRSILRDGCRDRRYGGKVLMTPNRISEKEKEAPVSRSERRRRLRNAQVWASDRIGRPMAARRSRPRSASRAKVRLFHSWPALYRAGLSANRRQFRSIVSTTCGPT